jgi:hypothetical protein
MLKINFVFHLIVFSPNIENLTQKKKKKKFI